MRSYYPPGEPSEILIIILIMMIAVAFQGGEGGRKIEVARTFDFHVGCIEGAWTPPSKYFDFGFGCSEGGGHTHQNILALTWSLDAQRGADTPTKIL